MSAKSVLTTSACVCAIACSGSQPGEAPAGCPRDARPSASEVWLASVADDDVFELSSVAVDVANDVILARSVGETRKLGPDGHTLWSQPFGSLVATDRAGNVYVTGTSPGVTPSAGGDDVFVAKLDPAGNVLYTSRVGVAPAHAVTGFAVDAD